MPILHAEVQVAGIRAACRYSCHSLYQYTDYEGRPNTDVRCGLVKLTFDGEIALADIWAELGLDSFRRVSGHLAFFHEAGHTAQRLTFYDAYCVHYAVRFNAQGRRGQAAVETDIHFSAAAVDLNGARLENYTRLWWENDPAIRFNALTPPAALLPSPTLRAPSSALLPGAAAPAAFPVPPKIALDPEQKPRHAPLIKKWYQKGGMIERLDNGNWKYTDWEHNSVVYEGDFPDFAPYERQRVDIPDMVGDCNKDFNSANLLAPAGAKLPRNTWHHHQNLTTMQEVPRDVHDRFTHYGARSIIRKRKAVSPDTGVVPSKLRKRK
jgi:Hemolysin coregulated protein Hcp (TssD)/A nuclease of the HNH/ENDO VII superfamily with conserved WHH